MFLIDSNNFRKIKSLNTKLSNIIINESTILNESFFGKIKTFFLKTKNIGEQVKYIKNHIDLLDNDFIYEAELPFYSVKEINSIQMKLSNSIKNRIKTVNAFRSTSVNFSKDDSINKLIRAYSKNLDITKKVKVTKNLLKSKLLADIEDAYEMAVNNGKNIVNMKTSLNTDSGIKETILFFLIFAALGIIIKDIMVLNNIRKSFTSEEYDFIVKVSNLVSFSIANYYFPLTKTLITNIRKNEDV